MREFGKIITRKTDLTDAQVQEKYKFPAIIILHDNEDQILKITHYQKNGTKTVYDFSQSASKQFVTDSIATAIAGLQDNRLEFNEFSDFPAIGDETKFYIDLTEDKIYIWDAYSQTYKNQSWDTATIAFLQASIASAQMAFQNLQNSKLDKGTYTGTASDLYLNDQNLLQSLQNEQSARYSADQGLQNSKLDKPLSPNNISTRVVNADNSTSDKGEFQLSEQIEINTSQPAQASWRGKEVWVTASCTLTIPDPATLPPFWSIDIFVLNGTLTHAITSPATWIGSAPANAPADSFYRIVRRGNTNSFKILGL